MILKTTMSFFFLNIMRHQWLTRYVCCWFLFPRDQALRKSASWGQSLHHSPPLLGLQCPEEWTLIELPNGWNSCDLWDWPYLTIFPLKCIVFISEKPTLSKEKDDTRCSWGKRNSVSPKCYRKYLSIATNVILEDSSLKPLTTKVDTC